MKQTNLTLIEYKWNFIKKNRYEGSLGSERILIWINNILFMSTIYHHHLQ